MTRKDTLLRRFPDYASSLTLDGVIDILYGISFLGVRRKHDTVYSYQDSARVEPDECQFYIHPCFRQALRSATATNLHPYRRPAMIQEAGAQNIGAIGHFRTRADPEFELMYSLRRAANRLLSLLDDPDLPPEAAAEIGSRIHCMRDDTDRARQQLESDPNSVNLAEYVRWACSFMQEISYRLMQSSLGDDPRVRHVARTAEDEARRIARDAGIRLAR